MDEKKKFLAAHQKATVLEEIKSVALVQMPIPKIPGLQMQPQQQAVMVTCAIIFEEEVVETIFKEIKN